MNTKILRQKVLDLAIHGNLVPQNPEHESAADLLEKIRETDKNYNPISIDEIPFEIPENWCWCRLGTFCNIISGYSFSSQDFTPNSGVPCVKIINVGVQEFIRNEVSYLPLDFRNKYEKFLVTKGDMLIALTRSYIKEGFKVCCYDQENTALLNQRVAAIKSKNKYVYLFLQTPYVLKYVVEKSHFTNQPNLSITDLLDLLIPLPPLEEQKLIVEEIERIFALIDTVEQNKTDLETVIKQTKSKILDLAIHGKLVPQDKADEPASKMLEKLRAEKEEKIAKGQLKQDKNDSYIYKSADGKWLERKADGSEEEIEVPFEIPESWSWCRLPSVCRRNITDGTHNSPPTNDEGEFLYITAKNIKLSGIDLSNVSYVSKEIHDVIYGRCPVELNDVLLTKDGTIGEVTVNNLDYPFSLLSSVALIKPSNIVESWFITYVLKSDYMQNIMKGSSKGVALKRIILEQINQLLIPIPPLEEQKRIIEKIQRIFFLLDKL